MRGLCRWCDQQIAREHGKVHWTLVTGMTTACPAAPKALDPWGGTMRGYHDPIPAMTNRTEVEKWLTA